jgi:hypothetical protein
LAVGSLVDYEDVDAGDRGALVVRNLTGDSSTGRGLRPERGGAHEHRENGSTARTKREPPAV